MLARQGAHQVAQKSTTTAFPRWSWSRNVRPSKTRTAKGGATRSAPPACTADGQADSSSMAHINAGVWGDWLRTRLLSVGRFTIVHRHDVAQSRCSTVV